MAQTIIPLLTPDDVRALRAPTDSALGLPGRSYFAPEFYEAERRKIFAAGWMGVGFASDIPNPGDARAVTIAGWELLLVRDAEGGIRCFHNVCRHRGMKVVEGKCSARNLRCRYHSWTYGLDGKLLATPAIAGIRQNESVGIDKAALGLAPVRCEEWLGVVFANIDGQALPLREHMRSVINRVERSFEVDQVEPAPGGRSGEFSYAANWKIILEGSIEDYHLPFVHKAFDYSADYVTEDGGSVYAGFSARRSIEEATRRYATEGDGGLQLPMFPKMVAAGVAESMALFVFPNTVLSCGPYAISTSLIVPRGPERTDYLAKTHFLREAGAARYEALRLKNAGYWKEVFGEDEAIWETLQTQSRVRDELGLATRFSPHWERAMHLFQLYVADKVGEQVAR